MPTKEIVLWIYIVLLVAGGVTGFIKAKSKASLIASLAFAIALILCALGLVGISYAADIVLLILLVFFGRRFAKSRKFMPGGLMALLTAVTLVLRQILK
jgi:uncharacterized membrane protein (UPF0136 family)